MIDKYMEPAVKNKVSTELDEFKVETMRELPQTTETTIMDYSKTQSSFISNIISKYFIETGRVKQFVDKEVKDLEPVVNKSLEGVSQLLTKSCLYEVKLFLKLVDRDPKLEAYGSEGNLPPLQLLREDASIRERITHKARSKIRAILCGHVHPHIMKSMPDILASSTRHILDNQIDDVVRELKVLDTPSDRLDKWLSKLKEKVEQKSNETKEDVVEMVRSDLWVKVEQKAKDKVLEYLFKAEEQIVQEFDRQIEKIPGI